MAQVHPAGLVTRTRHGDGAPEINRTFGRTEGSFQLGCESQVVFGARSGVLAFGPLARLKICGGLIDRRSGRASFPPCISPRPGGWVETLARSLKRGSVASAVERTSWDGGPTARPDA